MERMHAGVLLVLAYLLQLPLLLQDDTRHMRNAKHAHMRNPKHARSIQETNSHMQTVIAAGIQIDKHSKLQAS